jgi:hypothetical protein
MIGESISDYRIIEKLGGAEMGAVGKQNRSAFLRRVAPTAAPQMHPA